jgi:hypothetical protein
MSRTLSPHVAPCGGSGLCLARVPRVDTRGYQHVVLCEDSGEGRRDDQPEAASRFEPGETRDVRRTLKE